MATELRVSGKSLDVIAEWVITLFALGVMVTAFTTAMSFPRNAALFPLAMSGLGAVLLALKLVRMILLLFVSRGGSVQSPPASEENAGMKPPEPSYQGVLATTSLATWVETLVGLVIFFTLLVLVGLVPTLVLFGIGYLMIVARKSFLFSAIYVSVLIGTIYLLFVRLLSLPLPRGMFPLL